MATSASTVTDPYLAAYYAQQTANVNDSYGMQLAQNQDQKALTDLSYTQKMQALRDKLGQENDTFRDAYGQRGLLNSGIYNFQSPNYANMGALQQFGYNSAESQGNLLGQMDKTNATFNDKNNELLTQKTDQLQGIQQMQAPDVARTAISDAITAGG